MEPCGGTRSGSTSTSPTLPGHAEHPRAAAQRPGAGVPRADVPRGAGPQRAQPRARRSAMPFPWTINPYRGCCHSCVYCFARKHARMARIRLRPRLRHADRGQDEPGRRAAPGAGPAVLDARARRARHEHRPVPAGRGPLPADARRHPGAGRLGHAVLRSSPRARCCAATSRCWPRRPRAGPARPRRLHGDLGRRPARRPRAGRADAAGPAGPGPGAHRRRPAVRGLPRPGAARADRRRRSTWTPRSARSPRPAPPGSPSSRCTCGPGAREWFMAWLRARPPGAGAALRAALRPAGLRAGRVPHLAGRSGSRRCCASTGWTGSPAERPGGRRTRSPPACPGDEEVGFPAGSLPTGGLPGVRPKGEQRRRPAVRRRPTPASSCPCSDRGPAAQPASARATR